MRPADTLRIAVEAVVRHKSRSFLTTLGIVIGVSAVLAMVAVGEGAKARVQEAFAAMGSNVLVVASGSTTAGGLRAGAGSMPTLTWDDWHAIGELPSVSIAAPQLRTAVQVVAEHDNWGTTVFGVTPEYFDIRNWGIEEGEPLTQADVDGATTVAVLGQTVVDRLFGMSASVVGQVVQLNNVPFSIAGIAAAKGQSASGHDYDDAVFIPMTTFSARIQRGLQQYLSGVIYVAAASADMSSRAEREITSLMRERHHLRSSEEDDFSVRNLTEVAAARQEGARTMTALLASIAAVSLVVGGIGIMNIMLVSVAERTREIGLRMAIGARRGAILAQFLTEALVLAGLGGVGGVVLGIVAAHQITARFGWPVRMRLDVMVLALAFSGAVGVVFGLYPARKASRMDPVEALRHE